MLGPLDGRAVQKMATLTMTFFVELAFQTFVFGMYFLMMIASVYIWSSKRQKLARASNVMFAITLVLFFSTSIYWATSSASMIAKTNLFLPDGSDRGIQKQVSTASLSAAEGSYRAAYNVAMGFNFGLTDIVVVWRCFSLYREKKKLCYIPLTFLTLTIISSIVFIGLSAVSGDGAAHPAVFRLWVVAELVMETLSMCTNLSATVLIGMKSWENRDYIREYLRGSNQQPRTFGTDKVLILLTESGVIYVVLQALLVIITVVTRAFNTPLVLKTIMLTYQNMFVVMSAALPTLVVIIVAVQQSVAENAICPTSFSKLYETNSVASVPSTLIYHH